MESESADRSYLDATEALVSGDAGRAIELLEQTSDALRGSEWDLAMAKSCLALSRDEEARSLLERVAADAAQAPEARAYALLLLSSALAGTGRAEDALSRLEEVAGLDSRLERPARALERRIRAGEPPRVTL